MLICFILSHINLGCYFAVLATNLTSLHHHLLGTVRNTVILHQHGISLYGFDYPQLNINMWEKESLKGTEKY
jgi:hypothetical protein